VNLKWEGRWGSDFPDHILHLGPGVQDIAEMNRKPEGGTYPAEQNHLVRFAQGRGEASVQADIQEPTVNVERVETMLNG
jgi:hypothetical protein